MIFEGSRYESTAVLWAVDVKGVGRPTLYPSSGDPFYQFRNHQVEYGDRLDLLAWRYLGNEILWSVILDMNPEILYPDSLPEGMTIRVPLVY